MSSIKSNKIFADGNNAFKTIDKVHNKHEKGIVILGPPGIGKSTWLRKQPKVKGKKDWIDSDYLSFRMQLNHNLNRNNENDFKLGMLRADYMLEQSKLMGYRIIGALFWQYKADAVVIPPLNTHLKYLSKRKDLDKSSIKKSRKIFKDHAKKFDIPIFDSIEKAVEYTTKQKKKKDKKLMNLMKAIK